MATKKITEKVIETSAIRLSADETRAIMKAATANPKPISDYRCCGLVDLGLMHLVAVTPKDRTSDKEDCWKKIKKAALSSDQDTIISEFRKLREFDEESRKKEKGYVLTDLGQQVARGVRVSLNSQFSKVPC